MSDENNNKPKLVSFNNKSLKAPASEEKEVQIFDLTYVDGSTETVRADVIDVETGHLVAFFCIDEKGRPLNPLLMINQNQIARIDGYTVPESSRKCD